MAYAGATLQRLVDRRLERGLRAATEAPVGGDHHLDPAVLDAGRQRISREPSEHDRVRGADPGTGEHRHHGLGDHRQVDRDPVALGDAELGEGVGRLLDLSGQLGVSESAGVTRLALEVVGDPVAEAGLDVPVQAVVRGVERAVGVPGRERRVAPVEDLAGFGVPADPLGLLGPEGVDIGRRLLIGRLGDVGGGGEILRRRKASILVEQVFQSLVTHVATLSARVRAASGPGSLEEWSGG